MFVVGITTIGVSIFIILTTPLLPHNTIFAPIIGILVSSYFGTRWGFHGQVILVEETSVWNAMRRSSELVAGAWWRVFGIILVILLLYLMVHFILLISLGFVLALIGIDGGERDIVELIRSLVWEEHSPKELYHLLHIINTAIATLTLPIVGIGITLLYFDRRIRKEGFDIEMRVTHNLV